MDHNAIPYPHSLVALLIGFVVGIVNSILILLEASGELLSMKNILDSIIVTLICTITAFLCNSLLKYIQSNWKKVKDKYFNKVWRRKKD